VSRIGTLRTVRLWLDVVVVETGGRETVYVRKYVRVEAGPPMVGPVTLATLSLDGLKYALSIVSPRAVEALLVETRPTYALSGKTLLALKDAGVPTSIIDLVIALSRPDKFSVASRGGGGAGGGGGGFGGFPIEIWPGVPYAAEWGLPIWVYDEDYWYWGNCIYWDCLGAGIPIDPDYGDGDGGGQPGRPAEHGRVVNGLGYARVWPRDTGGGEGHSSGSGGGSAGSSGERGGSGSDAGSGSVSPSGYSHGSGGDTGRTAQPRDSSPSDSSPPPSSPPPQQ